MRQPNAGRSMNLQNFNYSGWYFDKGHTKLCSRCGAPHEFDDKFIGRVRALAIEACDKCKIKKFERARD